MIGRTLLVMAVVAAHAALAQDPRVSAVLAPDGPVTVGTAVEVTATVLVPTWMPEPPVWPDLQIADAITRLPERATRPVTERIDGDTWSGIARSWEIVPQRPADYDLGAPQVSVTYADADTGQPVTAALDLPGISFSATVPTGAEGMDPFIAATALTVTAAIDGLPDSPKPGDSFTLTLTTTADGPPAMLLPPLAERLSTPAGLRAYPRQPILTDGATATRVEAIVYVIETPGTHMVPGLTIDWWNIGTAERASTSTEPTEIVVSGGAGPTATPSQGALAWLAALAFGAGAAALALLARRRRSRPSARSLRRAVLRAARTGSPAAIRRAIVAWEASRIAPLSPAERTALDEPLRALERTTYGPDAPLDPDATTRRRLIDAVRAADKPAPRPQPDLPALNPLSSA